MGVTAATEKKVALVTGGGRGIGRAVCERLAKDNYTLCIGARTIAELTEVEASLAAGGAEVNCFAFDITAAEDVERVVAAIDADHGGIDLLVNSAGTSYIAPVAISKLERCEEVIRVNLFGAFVISRAVIRLMMRRRSGRIVHIGSISGQIGAPYNAIYAASKAGLAGLVKSLALEVAALGITVNAVQPGTVYTQLFEQTHGARARIKGISIEQQKQAMVEENPQKRLVTVEEVAEAVLYLASPGAAAVNGHLLTVDGGRSII